MLKHHWRVWLQVYNQILTSEVLDCENRVFNPLINQVVGATMAHMRLRPKGQTYLHKRGVAQANQPLAGGQWLNGPKMPPKVIFLKGS